MLSTHQNSYVFGRGEIFVDVFDANGKPQGERFIGNCPGFTLSIATEKFEHFSSTSGLRKKDLTVPLSVNFNAAIECDDVSDDNLALCIGGSVQTVTQTATPVTGESIKVRKGLEYRLGVTPTNPSGVQQVSAVSVKKGASTYILGTDYTVDAAAGRIYILPTGAIVDGDAVDVGYTPAAGTIKRVASGASGAVAGAVVFRAKNAAGPNRQLVISSAALSAKGDIPFITTSELAKFTLDVGVNERDSATPQILIDGVLVTS